MKRNLQITILYIFSLFTVVSTMPSCTGSEENVQHDLMTVYELNTAVKAYDETSQFLEVTAQLDYVDIGYLKVDVHPINANDENAWRSSFIYDDFEGDIFHGQFNIPEKTVGEYEVVLYIVDQNNVASKSATEIYIDKYPLPILNENTEINE